jgi:hypothetical protein
MLNTIITSQSGKEVTFKSPYAIVCNGVKKTSNAKKTIAHRLEAQFNQLATTIDKRPNGFVARMKRK